MKDEKIFKKLFCEIKNINLKNCKNMNAEDVLEKFKKISGIIFFLISEKFVKICGHVLVKISDKIFYRNFKLFREIL